MAHLHNLQKEIKDSTNELENINPLYENQVIQEKEITKEYVDRVLFKCFMIYCHFSSRLVSLKKS